MTDNRRLLGVRVSPEFHRKIKQVALDNDITIQDYILGLILTDIQSGTKKTKYDFWEELKNTKGKNEDE